jgi:tRNA (cytidine/uridine-2'-O-)-methyltransferase
MDYLDAAALARHVDWAAFERRLTSRIVLLTTSGPVRLHEAELRADDILLLGSESRGVPENVHARADLRVRIPQMAGTRSLNIAVAAGIALGEALRQTGGWPR